MGLILRCRALNDEIVEVQMDNCYVHYRAARDGDAGLPVIEVDEGTWLELFPEEEN